MHQKSPFEMQNPKFFQGLPRRLRHLDKISGSALAWVHNHVYSVIQCKPDSHLALQSTLRNPLNASLSGEEMWWRPSMMITLGRSAAFCSHFSVTLDRYGRSSRPDLLSTLNVAIESASSGQPDLQRNEPIKQLQSTHNQNTKQIYTVHLHRTSNTLSSGSVCCKQYCLLMATRRCWGVLSWFQRRDINDFTYLLTYYLVVLS